MDIEVVSAEANMEGAAEEVASLLEVVVPAGQRSGVLHLEVARGALLSGPKVCTDKQQRVTTLRTMHDMAPLYLADSAMAYVHVG